MTNIMSLMMEAPYKKQERKIILALLRSMWHEGGIVKQDMMGNLSIIKWDSCMKGISCMKEVE